MAMGSPGTAGVSLGLTQSEADAMDGPGAFGALGAFGRLGFTHRMSGQLEVSMAHHDGWTVSTATTSLVVDLGSSRWLVPVLHAGIGLDVAMSDFPLPALHAEAGAGLEFRLDDGLSLGADVTVGERGELDGLVCGDGNCVDPVGPGAYRTAKLTLGTRF